MDILFYELLKKDLIRYNEFCQKPYGNEIVPFPTTDTTFPHTVFREIRNTTNTQFDSPHDRVANVGYRADIYAKTKNFIDKETIAREIAKMIDDFFTQLRVPRVSFNTSFEGQNQSICHIMLTYNGNLSEFRRKFI